MPTWQREASPLSGIRTGSYFFINQGKKINDEISVAEMISLNEDGTVSGAAAGTWERKEGTYYMSLTCDDAVYSGVFCQMKDEAGTEVMTFSAVGDNQSV
ncbi:MAG: hypothetical protein HFI98_05450, partial [Lachnospiraceae bacterium]|nr:hypothetical protein [Lachnospiraceae bacterium]